MVHVVIMVGRNGATKVAEHIVQVHAHPVPEEGIPAAAVDHLALGIHDVIVFQEALTHGEVVFLHLFLGLGDRFGDHPVLDNLALFQAQAVHDLGDPLGTEETHQFVFQGDIELGRPGVTLTTGTTAQLTVNPPGFVSFRTQDGQTAGFFHGRGRA